MTPHKCPVCDGTGLVARPPGVAGDWPEWASSSCGPYPCRACAGTGVIWGPEPPREQITIDAKLVYAKPGEEVKG